MICITQILQSNGTVGIQMLNLFSIQNLMASAWNNMRDTITVECQKLNNAGLQKMCEAELKIFQAGVGLDPSE